MGFIKKIIHMVKCWFVDDCCNKKGCECHTHDKK